MRSPAHRAVVAVVLSFVLQGQTGTGELRGVLSNVRGPIAGLEIRIKNTSTGEVATTTTSSSGEYSMRVAPGRYDVFAILVGYGTLALRDLDVRRASPSRLTVC
jgi:hypothetical protein